MADNRRGKKTNHNKNHTAAKDFADGKKIGRPKQEWVWTMDLTVQTPLADQTTGYWRKA